MALAIAHFLITSRRAISSSESEFPSEVGFIKFLPFPDFRAYTPRPTVRPLEMDAGRRYIKVARPSVPLGAVTSHAPPCQPDPQGRPEIRHESRVATIPIRERVNRYQSVVIAGGNHRLRVCPIFDLCTHVAGELIELCWDISPPTSDVLVRARKSPAQRQVESNMRRWTVRMNSRSSGSPRRRLSGRLGTRT